MNQEILETLHDMLAQRKDPANDVEWQDIADYLSSATGTPYNRTYLRKAFPIYDMFESAGWVRPPEDVGGSSFDAKRLEAEKAIVKLRDERNEIARIQRELARRESMVDLVKEAIRGEVSPASGYIPHEQVQSDNDVIIHLTDIHGGIEVHNCFNDYDTEVMYDRLSQYLGKVAQIRARHGSEHCYLMLGGDLVSGLIHTAIRIENNLDVIRQVKVVAMAISWFVQELSKLFGQVHVYSVPGNHARVTAKKEDSLRGENLDILVQFILGLSLKEYGNVTVHENLEESVAMFSVRGQKVFGVHGDKDGMDTVVQKLTMMFGMKPDIVLAGHRHTNGMSTVYDTKVVQSGCVVGPDSYCMDHRLRNNPEQTVLVVTCDGLECLYDVTLH